MGQKKEPGIGKTVFADLRRGDFRKNVKKDYRDAKEFFLTDDRKRRLKKMGWLRRWLSQFYWLFKSLFLKLTPPRRIMLIIGLIFIFISGSTSDSGNEKGEIFGILIVLFVLMLELKDKLIAKTELHTGRAVQDALMPEKNPSVQGWSIWLYTQPANDVGGDLVDFMQLNSKRFGIALGDVAGKGLGAALLMAKLQSTIRALAPDYDLLNNLAEKINRIIYRDGLPSRFASLVYLEINSESNKVKFFNAGHLPPVVVKNDNIKSLTKGQTAIGLSSQSKYKEQKLELNKNDLMIIYSDGVTEARNENNKFFGEENFFQLIKDFKTLTGEEIGNKIISRINQFTGSEPASDDISLVILKRTL